MIPPPDRRTELTLLSLLEEETVRRLDWTNTRGLKALNCSELVANAIACCLLFAAVKFHTPTPEASTLQEPSISPKMLLKIIRNMFPSRKIPVASNENPHHDPKIVREGVIRVFKTQLDL